MEDTSRATRPRARAAVLALLVTAFGWSLYGLGRAQGAGETPAPLSTAEPAAAVAERLAPSVVRIEHSGGQGSGVVYDDGGMILTAGHVVAGVAEVEVRTTDGDSFTGEVLGVDPSTDVGVVDVDGDLPVPELATEDDLRVGQVAVAIGSPYGLDETVTLGIVSALDRSVTTDAGTIDGLIQTDAPINPGNSGGPLADGAGRVIGINHAIASSSGGNEGVGFAIPVETALESAEAILAGEVEDEDSDRGLLPDLPFPDQPFGEEHPFGGDFAPPLEDLPKGCLPGRFEEVLPGFPDVPDFEAPDVPEPDYLPSGWQIVGVMTNRVDGGTDELVYEVEVASREERMTITLGNAASVVERAEELAEREDAEETEVERAPASVVEDADRLYLVFDLGDLTGIVDGPRALGIAEVVRVAGSIRR